MQLRAPRVPPDLLAATAAAVPAATAGVNYWSIGAEICWYVNVVDVID